MEFIEAPAFTKHVYAYMSDDDYADLQLYLFQHPESGDLIPGSGGIRKLRWVLPEKKQRQAWWRTSDLLFQKAER